MQHIFLETCVSAGFLRGKRSCAKLHRCKVGKPLGAKTMDLFQILLLVVNNYVSNDIEHHQWAALPIKSFLQRRSIITTPPVDTSDWKQHSMHSLSALPIKYLLTFNNLQKPSKYDEPIQSFHNCTFKVCQAKIYKTLVDVYMCMSVCQKVW